jgi:hypothetical protein
MPEVDWAQRGNCIEARLISRVACAAGSAARRRRLRLLTVKVRLERMKAEVIDRARATATAFDLAKRTGCRCGDKRRGGNPSYGTVGMRRIPWRFATGPANVCPLCTVSKSALPTSRPVAGSTNATPATPVSNQQAVILPEGGRLICLTPGCAASALAARSPPVCPATAPGAASRFMAGNSGSTVPLSARARIRTAARSPGQR